MAFKPYKFNPIDDLGLDIPARNRKAAMEAAAEYLKEAMLDYIGDGKSPVANGKWTRSLTKAYLARKGEESSAGFANLELSGDFLDSLSVEAEKNKIVIDVGEDQEGKAEGHITGLYGENAKKPRPRQFMPQKDGKFNRDILSNLKKLLSEYEEEDSGE